MQSQDILFIVLAVCSIFISVPLMLVLWRVYTTLDHTDKILKYINHLRELAIEFESVPMKLIESLLSNFTKEEKSTPKK